MQILGRVSIGSRLVGRRLGEFKRVGLEGEEAGKCGAGHEGLTGERTVEGTGVSQGKSVLRKAVVVGHPLVFLRLRNLLVELIVVIFVVANEVVKDGLKIFLADDFVQGLRRAKREYFEEGLVLLVQLGNGHVDALVHAVNPFTRALC